MSAALACYICTLPIGRFDVVNHHHVIYRSQGGTETAPTHKACHVRLHSEQNDFREWGRRSAQTRRWAFNLKNVRTHPAYDFDRAYYSMMYAQ